MSPTTPNAPKWRDITTISPYGRNAKKHDAPQVKKIAASIKQYGWRGNPIIVNQDGVIIAGHGRRLAAIELGMDKVPVVVEAMTEEEERAYRLADNRAAEGAIDGNLLKEELLDLPEFAIEGLGDIFDKKELDFMSVDVMEMNADVFAVDLDTVMDTVDNMTEEKIEQVEDKRVALQRALGFKSFKGSDMLEVSRFMALITGETGLGPEEAFVQHAKRVTEAAT